MHYLVLASDYDGTLATDGRVAPTTLAAVDRWRRAGGKFVLATGRELNDLLATFDRIEICDRVVAENGALLYDPKSQRSRLLCDEIPRAFVEKLAERGVGPILAGRGIASTWQPHEATVQQTIYEMQLPLEIILNKRAVMVLPHGVDKRSGLQAALEEFKIDRERAVGIGDAENDIQLLDGCGFGIAVGNALPALKQHADWVTVGERGAGVEEAIARLLSEAGGD